MIPVPCFPLVLLSHKPDPAQLYFSPARFACFWVIFRFVVLGPAGFPLLSVGVGDHLCRFVSSNPGSSICSVFGFNKSPNFHGSIFPSRKMWMSLTLLFEELIKSFKYEIPC